MKNQFKLLVTFLIVIVFTGCKKEEPEEISAPISCFTYTVDELKVTFNADCSENAVDFFWDFGDNETTQVGSPVHTYEKFGAYKVVLKVDNESGTNSVTETIDLEAKCVRCTCYNDGVPESSQDFCGSDEDKKNFEASTQTLCSVSAGNSGTVICQEI